MLTEKKIHLAQSEINFLGMHFSKGFYQPQKHIAEELLKFPDHSLTTKQIQQVLGIRNYIRDFIPKAARYTGPLSKLLKKNTPPWRREQTEAVQQIKKIAQDPPALKIPDEGNKILQTDASDRYWGAEAEVQYHTTYKEALVVKNGIKKFDFQTKKTYQILTNPLKHEFLFWTLLEWFSPITWCRSELEQILSYQESQRKSNGQTLVSTFIFYRPYAINSSGQLFSQNHAYIWGTFEEYPLNDSYKRQLKIHLQEANLNGDSPLNMLIPSSSGSRQTTVCSEYHIPTQTIQRTEELVSPEEDDFPPLQDLGDYILRHQQMQS
ncbi:hypothetical protein V8G54_033572 [Vigna mungo]|uniref:Reverse transcriptase/retrotransposon-derived protein RNase H-like domain-containing protein n=1 Tax=Vigna mungo TaxID=3915 RepID=A0AAQ3MQ25_VIGMU